MICQVFQKSSAIYCINLNASAAATKEKHVQLNNRNVHVL